MFPLFRGTEESIMNFGPKNSSGSGGKGRRRRGRRGPGGHPGKGQHKQSNTGGVFTHPMDHSYRTALHGNSQHPGKRVAGTQYLQPDPEPLPQQHENAAPRIFAFIDDLFFLAKIQEISRKLNVKVEFVKTEKDILDRAQNGSDKPSLIIFDLNNANAKPLATIPRLKKELKKGTTIIGFLSHVQGDLKVKAMEAGCDMVIPRSAFSQNLPSLLRRHGAPEELDVH
jgi:CheY-like chemotaxis protein